MNEKISFPDLVGLLSSKMNITKKEAETFLKEFFTVSTEVITSGEELRINGLGLFKPIWVEARGSINIQTGEPVEIPGHYKLSFIPDKVLREAVNAPFSSFSVEVLNDHVPIEDMTAVPSQDIDENNDICNTENVELQDSKEIREKEEEDEPREPAHEYIQEDKSADEESSESTVSSQEIEKFQEEIIQPESETKVEEKEEDCYEDYLRKSASRKSGIRVVYSTPGLKVHAKALLIKCSTLHKNQPQAYAFLSTGNFNENTARIYSDMGLFTINREITSELDKLFSILDGSSNDRYFQTLLVAQFNMVDVLKQKINFEIEEARQGRKAHIILKMNGLHDTNMINALYDASEAGVHIDLIVRGINCLVPNQPYSRNIRMIRIIDSYLEHARIWYFYAGGHEDIYLSSADWMRRNLNRRIETAVPIFDQSIKNEILSIISLQLQDNVKACYIDENLENHYVQSREAKFRSQRHCFQLLEKYSIPDTQTVIPEIFIS